MSIIRHLVHQNTRLYAAVAAAALAIGLVAVLVITAFQTSSDSVAMQKPPPRTVRVQPAPYSAPCLESRSAGSSMALVRSVCRA